jgi:hypothetical protein
MALAAVALPDEVTKTDWHVGWQVAIDIQKRK